jgi:ketosteroid isomerase-like protein
MTANAEIVRRVAETWRDDPDAAAALLDEQAVMDWSASRAPYSGVFRGRDEIKGMWRGLSDAWEQFTVEVEEAIEVDPETVLSVTHVRGIGRGSGVSVEAHGAGLWSVRGGKIISGKLYQSKEEAIEAVRAREPDAARDQPAGRGSP